MADAKVTKDLDQKTLTIEWEVEAPKEKVWRAYADKEWFEQWWGPVGWETTAKEFDFKPGGRIHYDMKCIDMNQTDWFGKSSWGMMVIDDIDEPNSFTYTDYFSDENGTLNQELPALKVTNEFIEQNGMTKVVSRSQADSAEQIEQLLEMGMAEGFMSQLTRLDVLLGSSD